MRFIVAAPDFSEAHGGTMVLHHLAHLLAKDGHETYIASNITFPESRASLLRWTIGQPFEYKIDSHTMAIYPEIIPGNPFHAKRVTRWILYKEGVRSKPIEYGDHDLVFQYNAFHSPLNRSSHGVLNIQVIQNEILRNTQEQRQIWFAHIVRKGAFKKPFEIRHRRHPPGSVGLDEECKRGVKHMSKLFNNIRLVVCYDSESFWAYAAALCGCLVVVIPTKGKKREQFWSDFPLFRYGIAYGWLDIPRALLTRNRINQHLKTLEEDNLASIRNYIRFVANTRNLSYEK